MKTIVYDRFGSADVLHMADVPPPAPAKGEVLVAVKASSVNVIDSRVRRGEMGLLAGKHFPRTPGADIAGTVAALGAGVTGLAVGDAVFGATAPFKGGAFAKYVSVPRDQLAPKPAALSFAQAAALPIAGLAALQSMQELGQVRPNQAVLIHGASGAVGLFAVQIAKHLGARVTAVAGTEGLAAVKAAGADTLIDYRTQNAGHFDTTFDVILNASGQMPFGRARKLLSRNGRLIEPSPTIPVFIGAQIANLARAQKHLMLQTAATPARLDRLARLVDGGVVRPIIAGSFALADARAAFTAMEKGGVTGKIVVTI